jgi:hypothetical protein
MDVFIHQHVSNGLRLETQTQTENISSKYSATEYSELIEASLCQDHRIVRTDYRIKQANTTTDF